MRFNTFNSVNAPHVPNRMSGAATLNMTINGGFSLSSKAQVLLDLKEGDKVVFLQDADYPTDWYIKKTTDKEGFVLRKTGLKTLSFKSSSLVTFIAKASLKTSAFSSVLFTLTYGENGLALDVKHPKINAPRKGNPRKK